jgi:hypothetical protein
MPIVHNTAAPTTPALDGTDITSPTAMPAGGVGIRGWLSAIWTKLNNSLAVTGTFWQAIQPVSGTVTANAGTGTLAVSAATLPLPAGAAQDGTDITSPTAMPAGGVGIRGWLSAIWTKLNGTLAVTGTFWQATQPVSGTVTANAGTGTMTVTGSGSAGSAATGVQTMQGIAGGVALPVSTAAPTAANILNGFGSFAATTAATTLITVPATRTWVGTVGLSVASAIAAASTVAGQARGVITVAGTNVTPAAGTVMAAEAKAGANAAAGTVGSSADHSASMPLVVVAPAGNAVTVQVTSTVAGTAGVVDAWASGVLQ